MSEKPLLVLVSTDNPDDLVEITDTAGNKKQRLGLSRCAPYTMLEKTFLELVEYICDPIGSDGNPSYEGEERDLAIRYTTRINDAKQNNRGVFYAKHNGVKLNNLAIKYDDKVSQYFGQIVEQKTIDTQGGPIECKSIDLLLGDDYGGGFSSKKISEVANKLQYDYVR